MTTHCLYGFTLVPLGDRRKVWQIDRLSTILNGSNIDKANLIFAAQGHLKASTYTMCLVCEPAEFGLIKCGVMLCNMPVDSVSDLPIDTVAADDLAAIIRADYTAIRTAAQKGVS